MADLEELLISVNSELGDISGIQSAIGALESLKEFSVKASSGATSLEKMSRAFSNMSKLGNLATGVNKAKNSVNDLIKVLKKLAEYTDDASHGINQLSKLGEALKSFNGVGQNLKGLDKAADGIKGIVDAVGQLSGGETKGAIEQLKALGEALQAYNNLGKNLAGLENIQDGVHGMLEILKALSEYKGKATQSIAQFGKLGESLQKFNELGKNLDGLDKIYKGVDKMVGVLERLSKVDVDSQKSINQLGKLGEALHRFNGLDESLVNLNDVALALINLGKATDMMKSTNKGDFKYISNLADAIKSFDGILTGRQFTNVANITSGLAALTTALADTKKIDTGSIREIGVAIREAFSNDDFLHSAGRITNVMHELSNAYGMISTNAGSIRDTMSTMVGGFQNAVSALYEVRQNIEAISTDFTDALAPVTNSKLFETLEEFKRLNDSYKNVGGLGQGLGKLLESLNALKGQKVDITPLKELFNDMDKLANDSKIEQLGSKFQQLGNMAQPVGILLNSLKYTDLKQGNNTLQTLAHQLAAFYEALPPKFDKISYTLNAIHSLVDLVKESDGIKLDPTNNIFINLAESLKGFGGLLIPNLADFTKGVTELLQFLSKLPQDTKINTEPLKQLLDTLQYADSSMKNASILLSAVRSIGDVNKIDTSKFKDLNEELNNLVMIFAGVPNLDKNAFKGVSETIKSLVDATNKDINAEQLNLIVEALAKLADHLANIQGSNNRIDIKLDASGVAHFREVIHRTDEEYREFAKDLDEALENIDMSSIFNMDAPLKSLRQQLKEAERMYHSLMKQMENQRGNVDRSVLTGRTSLAETQMIAYKQMQERAVQLKDIINDLNIAIEHAPKFETDKEGYQYIHNLKEELRGLEEFTKRFKRGDMGEVTEEMGRGFKDVQDRIVAIQDEIKKAEADLKQMDETEEGLIYRTSEFANQMTRVADEAEKASDKMKGNIGEGFGKFGSMLTGSKNPILSSIGNLSNIFGKAVKDGSVALEATQLESLEGIASTLGSLATAMAQVAAVAGVVIAVFKTWWSLMNKLRGVLVKFVQSVIQFSKNMLTHVVGAFNAVAGAVSKVVSVVKSGAEMLASALRKIGDFGQNVINIFRRVGQAMPIAMKGIKAVLSAVTPKFVKTLASTNFNLSKIIKNTHLLKNAIKQVTRYFSMLTRMLMRKSITAFLNEMKQAFEDMVLFEKNAGDAMLNLNTNVSKMFSEMRRAANQWIAAFEPLINAIAPTVVNFFANIQAMGENVAKFMAILTGQPYYLRAKRFYQDYGESVENTRKRVKDLTNGLDELNILNDSKSSEIGEILPEDMFEKVPVDGMFNLPNIQVAIQDILDKIKDWLKSIDWEWLKEKAREIVRAIFEAINTILRDKEFWQLLGKTIGEIVNFLFTILNEAVHDLDWKALGQAIAELIKNALETIDWELIRDTVVTAAQGIATMWNEVFADKQLWKDIGETVAHVINDVIVAYLDNFAWTFDFKNMADSISLAIKTALEDIDWEQIRHAVDGWTKGITDAINQWASDKQLWIDLGETIKHTINDILINAFNDLGDINFADLTANLKAAIMRALDIDWEGFNEGVDKWVQNIADVINGLFADEEFLTKITTSIANLANAIINGFDKLLQKLKSYDIGKAIGDAIVTGLSNINWDTLFTIPADAINALSNALRGLLDAIPDDFNLGTWIAEHLSLTIESVDWDLIKKNINDFADQFVKIINGLIENDRLWENIEHVTTVTLDVVVNLIGKVKDINWTQLAERIKNYINNVIKGGYVKQIISDIGEIAIDLLFTIDLVIKGVDWGELGRQIAEGLNTVIDKLYAKRGALRQMIEDAFTSFSELISEILKGLLKNNSFAKMGTLMGELLLGIISGISIFFDANTTNIIDAMKQFADSLADYINAHRNEIVAKLNRIIDAIVDIIDSFFDEKGKLWEALNSVIEGLNLGKLFGSIIRNLILKFKGLLGQNGAIMQAIMNSLPDLIDEVVDGIKKLLKFIAKEIGKKLLKYFTNGDFLTDIFNVFLTGDIFATLKAKFRDFVLGLLGKIFGLDKAFDIGGIFDNLKFTGGDKAGSTFFEKVSAFLDKINPFKKKDKNQAVEVSVEPVIDDSTADSWDDLFDGTKKVPIELEDPKLGTITASLIEADVIKAKKLEISEEINAEVLNVIEIFADKLHVGEIDSDTNTKKKDLDPNYAGNTVDAQTGTVSQKGDLNVRNIYAELLDVKKIVSELLEVTEIKTELLEAQKIVTDLIDAKKIKTKLLDAKKIITKLLDAEKIFTKLLEVRDKILTPLIEVESKIIAERLEVKKLDIQEGADGISVSLQDTSSVLNLEGINAGWLNVPTITADLLRVGTIEGNIKGTSGYTSTGIIGVSTGNLPSSFDNMFGVPSIQKPRIEVGDRWSDISGLAPHAEDFLGEVESYWANVTDTFGKTVSVTPAVNLAGNDGGYGVVHTLPRYESGSNGNVIPLSDFDKNMSGVVAGAKINDLPSNANYIRDYLMSFIGNENGVYGLMGNLYAESGLLSNNLQDTKKGEGVTQRDLDYTKKANSSSSSFINDSKGYGLAQWTTSDRKKAFYDSLNGRSVDDLGAQLEYLKSELMSSQYKGVLDKLRNASTIEEASNAVLHGYEKPADQSSRVEDLRMAYGQDIAGQLGSYDGTVDIEDEPTPTTDGIKGFDEANVISTTSGNEGGVLSFLDTLPLQTEYRMAEVYNIIDKWLGRIYKLFKSFTVDGFLEDLLKLNDIGDIFDSTILKELRDVLEEIADLLRKLIEDGIKSVEDTRHLDLNTDAKSQNTRAVEDLTDAIYDWIKCAGDTGHLDNNTYAKSENTKSVESLNQTLRSIAGGLVNVNCNCNCCCNCSGCGGKGGSGGGSVPSITGGTTGGGSGYVTPVSDTTGGGTGRRTTPIPTGGTTGGGSVPSITGGTTGGGKNIHLNRGGKKVQMFIIMDGKLVKLSDDSPDYVKQAALSGRYAFVDAEGTSINKGEQRNMLALIKKKWGKGTGTTGGTSTTGGIGGTGGTGGSVSDTHMFDNPVNLAPNVGNADTGTVNNPSGTKTSGGNNLPSTKEIDRGGKPSNKSNGGGSNTGNGSHSDSDSSGGFHDETNNGGSSSGNTSGGSDSSNKDDSGIRRSSWGAIMHDGQYEQDGRIYNANGTVFAISHEKMAELEKEHAEEIAKKNQERAEEAKKHAEEANAKKKPFRDDENNQDGVNLANANVEKIRNKAKELLNNVNSNGSDSQKELAKSLYEHLMGNYTYGAGDWKDGSSPSTIMVDDIPIPVNGGYYQQEYYKLKNLSDQISALKPTDKDKSLSDLSSALGQIDVGDRTWRFSTGGTWYTSTKNSPDPQHKRQGRMDKLGTKFTNFEFEFTTEDAKKAGFNSVQEMFNALSKAGANIYSKSGSTLYETYKSNVLQLKSTQMAGLFDRLKSRYMAKGYQMGGIPNAGEIFVARENGTPEFVGSFGNRTAVANNDQIVTAVANGVAMANDSLRNAIENQTNVLENAIDRKDLEVNIGDRQIAEANRRGEKGLGQNFIS